MEHDRDGNPNPLEPLCRRALRPRPLTATLKLDAQAAPDSHGFISRDLYNYLFDPAASLHSSDKTSSGQIDTVSRATSEAAVSKNALPIANGLNHPVEADSSTRYVAITPWQPLAPDLYGRGTWTITAVRPEPTGSHGGILHFSSRSLALQRLATNVRHDQSALRSDKSLKVLISDVIPLPLTRVNVYIDGAALQKHVETQGAFAGGFVDTESNNERHRQGKQQLTTPPAGRFNQLGYIWDDETLDSLQAAVRSSLAAQPVFHTADRYPLPLPTHPITHVAFPPLQITACEPVDQGLLTADTEIIVNIGPGSHSKLTAGSLPSTRRMLPSGQGQRLPDPNEGSSTTSSSDETSDASEDDMLSLTSQMIPLPISNDTTATENFTQTSQQRNNGGTTPRSMFSSYTIATIRQSDVRGRAAILLPLPTPVPEHILHPMPEPNEDDIMRLFVDVRFLARLGCFSGDWINIVVSGSTPNLDQAASRNPPDSDSVRTMCPVKIYGLNGLASHVRRTPGTTTEMRKSSFSSTRTSTRSIPSVFVPPILFANLHSPSKIHLAPLSFVSRGEKKVRRHRLSGAAQPPVAQEVNLLRIPTPLTTERVMQPGIMMHLKNHFETRRRLVRSGDLIAIPFDPGIARTMQDVVTASEQHGTGLDDVIFSQYNDPWQTCRRRDLLWYKINSVTARNTKPESTPIDPAIWNGLVAIEPRTTRTVQSGSLTEVLPPAESVPWPSFYGLQPRPQDTVAQSLRRQIHAPPSAGYTSDMQRRLTDLLAASTHARAAAIGMPPVAILLHSRQAGAGKSTAASMACLNLGLHIFPLDAAEILPESGAASDVKTEASLRARLERALTCGSQCTVPLIRNVEFLDADRIAAALRESVAQFRAMIFTSCDIDKIPEGIRGLFTHELEIAPPDEKARAAILRQALTHRRLRASPEIDFDHIAMQTAAMVAGDLGSIVDRAGACREARLLELAGSVANGLDRDVLMAGGDPAQSVLAIDFANAVDAARKNFADAIGAPKIPNVAWEDVGGLAQVKDSVLETIQLPLERPELFASGLRKRSGILFYGPPGTGKTLLAKAIATEFSLNFFSVKGPELLNMYIGESEANVRRVFQRARDARPCVVFFDELDAIAPARGNQGDSGGVMDRMVSQLLAELDGMSDGRGSGSEAAGSEGDNNSVFVVAATNRPDLLDPALLRPGRFDKMLYLGIPDSHDAQARILKALTRKFAMAADVSLDRVAATLPLTYTGADLYALCSDAMLKAVMRRARAVDARIAQLPSGPVSVAQFFDHHATEADLKVEVAEEDFAAARRELVGSVSASELQHYQRIRQRFESSSSNASSTAVSDLVPVSSMASSSMVNGSHPPRLRSPVPLPGRTKSSKAMQERPLQTRKDPHDPRSNSERAKISSVAYLESTDDEAYLTSTDFATPDRASLRMSNGHDQGRDQVKPSAPLSAKARGKMRAVISDESVPNTGKAGFSSDAETPKEAPPLRINGSVSNSAAMFGPDGDDDLYGRH